MKEEDMNTNITMGNDEFILYIRKTYSACSKTNDELGHRIWKWIEENDRTAIQVDGGKSVPCYWGHTGTYIGETLLPKTATQFQFESQLLPGLYAHLDELGTV
jgi:hypothetical protein